LVLAAVVRHCHCRSSLRLSLVLAAVVRHSRAAGIQWLNDSGFPHLRE
jgi:hypothetical protein